ncbi:MAG: acetyl-CoA carboxylase biotin carboxyl carrier protein [Planctomycetota bacterium]|jgi:acetyl-CoA carboxylase biotin carboxyl carrier protein
MIDIRKLKELVRLMVANDLTELDLRDSEEQVTLRRHGQSEVPQVVATPGVSVPSAPAVAVADPSAPVAALPADTGSVAADAAIPGLSKIASPMVGTFYAAPSPDAPPFVTVGATIDADTVVCLIEAMKIFNEIKAECAGTIEKVLVSNGESVDFGQVLFMVRTR